MSIVRIRDIKRDDASLVLRLVEGREIRLSLDDVALVKDLGIFVIKDWLENQYESIAEESVQHYWQVIPTHFRIKSLRSKDAHDPGEKDLQAFLKRMDIVALGDLAEVARVSTYRVIQTLREAQKQKLLKVDFLVRENDEYDKAKRRYQKKRAD